MYISLPQMYAEVRGLAQTVSRIEHKLDGLLDETRDIRTDMQDHETRLRALERSRWPLPSLAALVGLAALALTLLEMTR
ncbi:hypothetical protein [Streptomyces sp. WMMC897]|uniref:hypothetical protein n=1 Tax=Streptomyces sp. WMMC897 TaxID=3014782 RepID=UPI0022B5FC37|nr:hypothetical protein [Streptomyces sp. WMMC897]MCZ7413030.1 hypothetical protein [Streptomyces sp. WMMC897]MCZ7413088.1 hypothetical protein [Streptomyces sp. WMMC897]MCZ7415440.1 hypothetical protein [Streptomyces sp. WMMC897]